MGYSFDHEGKLCCDNCGRSGYVRKRKCIHTVTWHDGMSIPYCPAPAVCPTCWGKIGGAKVLHAKCAEGARLSQIEQDAIREKINSGDLQVLCAYGSWHETVPENMTGVLFGKDRRDQSKNIYRLVPHDDYKQGGFLSDYPNAVEWPNHPGTTTKQIV